MSGPAVGSRPAWPLRLAVIAALLLTAGCAAGLLGARPAPGGDLDATLAEVASAGPMSARELILFTDNDAAFRSKLRLVAGARSTLDLAYYLFDDDYSSSALAAALMDAVARGVRVRLLVDYHTNYKNLDLFSMLEANAAGQSGSLEVRFYNRPTGRLVRDAAFMTLGCGDDQAVLRSERCDRKKYARIDRAFATETIDGQPAAERNISNLNIAGSGLFLSGLYAKRPDVMALAVTAGQGIDTHGVAGSAPQLTPEERGGLARVAKIYWRSKTGAPFTRLSARIELALAFRLHGEQLDPLRNTLVSLLPVERRDDRASLVDWDHLTDFLHHKYLLADGRYLQLGGRNVADAYHMHRNPLVAKYLFMDTDAEVDLGAGGAAVARAFDDLWGFRDMVATLDEVRRHAPNDLIANLDGYHAAEETCAGEIGRQTYDGCVAREYDTRFRDLPARMAERLTTLRARARIYHQVYAPTIAPQPGSPTFTGDPGTTVYFLENLPFDRHLPAAERSRRYGARNDHEAEDDKAIHAAWLGALAEACRSATPERPRRVIFHNAYVFPPADLLYALGEVISGAWQCDDVTVDVVTNSVETTDLSPINIAWRHAMKALLERQESGGRPAHAAAFAYHEYLPGQGEANRSLHSKVTVLGDDLVVGSANADVRSFMMDGNDALYLRHAPQLVADYTHFVDGLLHDPEVIADRTETLRRTPRATLITEDRATFRRLLERYGVAKRVTPAQAAELEARFVEALDRVYDLARDSLRPGRAGRQAREEFNDLFKPL